MFGALAANLGVEVEEYGAQAAAVRAGRQRAAGVPPAAAPAGSGPAAPAALAGGAAAAAMGPDVDGFRLIVAATVGMQRAEAEKLPVRVTRHIMPLFLARFLVAHVRSERPCSPLSCVTNPRHPHALQPYMTRLRAALVLRFPSSGGPPRGGRLGLRPRHHRARAALAGHRHAAGPGGRARRAQPAAGGAAGGHALGVLGVDAEAAAAAAPAHGGGADPDGGACHGWGAWPRRVRDRVLVEA